MKAEKIVYELSNFSEMWLSNPGARLNFANLIDLVLHCNKADHAATPVETWIDQERKIAKDLGVR